MGFSNSILLFIIILSIFFEQYVLHLPVVAAKDELEASQSHNGEFTLGFFTNTINSTNFQYLGIWYTYQPQGTKLWVANRDTPMMDDGALLLYIDESGTVKVINGVGTTLFVVFKNPFGTGNNTRVVFDDSGNFIVYNTSTTYNAILWQSFDYPTDTLLPGMKLGYNLTTKHNWTLTSWLSDVNPAAGAFTMRLEQYQNSPQLLIYRRGELYWASGPWSVDNGTFAFVDNDSSNNKYGFSLLSDATGMIFGPSMTGATLRLSPLGNFIDGSKNLVTPEFCYGYQSDDGCAVFALPSCRHQNDTFQFKKGDWTAGDHIRDYDGNSSISISDCMERCWNNCTCIGFSTNDDGTGCYTYAGDASFQPVELGNATSKYVLDSKYPSKTVVPRKSPKSKAKGILYKVKRHWIQIVVPVVVLLLSLPTAYLCCQLIQRCKQEEEKKIKVDLINQLASLDSFNCGDELEKGIKDAPNVKIFSLKAILDATENFSNENKLGEGGYGPVYKGRLSDGREFAVKRLSNTSRQGMDEFKTELILISKLQHTNLVRLYGCCIHNEEKMLIYEFMPNKSLDFFLFDEDKKDKIDWHIRFNIIEGIAQGLLYLHEYSRMKVIHRDLKVSNVLLDDDMNPKIADFGMARIFQRNVKEEMTMRVSGTFGYMAPEYAMRGTFSIKSDVFSFGVLILEIVSGKRNSKFHNVVNNAWELWKREATLELKDEALGESYDVKQLIRVIHVGLLCVQENANDRPRMQEVIYALNNEMVSLPTPIVPVFFSQPDEGQSSEYSLGNYIQVSENSLSVTAMEAR